MNKTAIKNFAIWARNKLIADISYRAGLMGITESGIASPLPQSTGTTEFYDIGTADPYSISGHQVAQRKQLVDVIRSKERDTDYKTAYHYIMEEVAYTWFNRLIAVRFMEVNDYLPSHIRVLSSETGKLEPDLVTTPFDADLEFTAQEEATLIQMKQDNKLDEAFRLLFIKQCNALNEILPALFEVTGHYTELLLNLSVIDQDGVIWHLVHDIDEEDWTEQVEIIGWLYQYYISEKHEQIVNIYKGTVKKDDIPAATQLFTTDWVVRYMVDNSLGRYWIERHPESGLAEKLEFFVKPKDGTIHYVDDKVSPQEMTCFDSCMGSGHILLYAFDVLLEIYRECGFTDRDAVSEIMKNNLYGVDIDDRCSQLAYFSLMMKARSYDRRFLTRGIYPHVLPIQESNGLSAKWTDGGEQMQILFESMKNAKECGSILTVPALDFDGLRQFAQDKVKNIEQFDLENTKLQEQLPQVLLLIDAAEVLAGKYVSVCTNPPYLNKMEGHLKEFVVSEYKPYSGDLFSVFIYRNFGFCKQNGYSAFMTPFVWMFIKTYENLRKYIIENKKITTLVQMEYSAFEEATVPICSFVLKNGKGEEPSLCFRLSDFKGGMEIQKAKVLEAIVNPNCSYFYETQQSNFVKIPGSPVAYWVSEAIYNAFEKAESLESLATPKKGLATTDNARFLRMWHEVDNTKMAVGCKSREDALLSRKKWFPLNKGGEFRRWYGNKLYFVNWFNDGKEMKDAVIERYNGGTYTKEIRSENKYFIDSITWSALTAGKSSFRFSDYGALFDSAGSSMFPKKYRNYILGLLNTKIVDEILTIINPTLNYGAGSIANIPVIIQADKMGYVEEIVKESVLLSRNDWDFYETSWDFIRHPLVGSVSNLSDAFEAWQDECASRFIRLKANEEELNRIFIDIYGLQDELTPEIEDKDVTVRLADKTRDIKSLLSYAVGCMFGRYSLDVDGLAYAGGEWDSSKYSSFIPDADNVIPITDEEYLEDDIIFRLCQWLKAVYGESTLEQNLDFIAGVLGNKGDTSREVIRNYFLKDFFKDHCQIYQKRPIYWLFDSGKQNGFKALIYLHRYNADTIGNLRIDYLHRMQRVYESETNRMQDTIDHSDNSREVAQATKRKEKLQKQLKECREYDEKISHLALARIELDLDDGVKVNYEKVQTARDGKKYSVLAKL